MLIYNNRLKFARCLRIIISGLLFFQIVNAQLVEKDLHKMIDAGSWSSEELGNLQKGNIVVRSLETEDRQEIASIGILRITNMPRISMSAFRESLSQKGSDSKKAGGGFSDPPTLEDLRNLELDKESIEQLQKCVIGKCDLNLSAEMIGRFQNEIDWNSPDVEAQTTRLIQEMLVDYAREYQARGDTALGTYDNRRKRVDLSASHRSLLSSSSFITDLAPEFAEYLKGFPSKKLDNVESSMHWSVVDFGLKSSITVSHSSAYSQVKGDSEQYYVASKQIYASRYLDSSLTFTLLLRVSTVSGVDTYLVFVDRSRSDALEGALGRFARDMVQKESAARIKTLLDKTHLRMLAVGEAARKINSASEEEGSSTHWVSVIRQRSTAITIGGIIVLVALFLLWQRKRASRTER